MANILIVDDSPTETHIYKTMLEKNGYQVITASTGEKGVERAKKYQPDLILMDVIMPGINGFQATRMIAKDKSTENIPIIIITTKDQETDKIWGMRQGAKDYIVKPVKEKELIMRVKDLGVI